MRMLSSSSGHCDSGNWIRMHFRFPDVNIMLTSFDRTLRLKARADLAMYPNLACCWPRLECTCTLLYQSIIRLLMHRRRDNVRISAIISACVGFMLNKGSRTWKYNIEVGKVSFWRPELDLNHNNNCLSRAFWACSI